MIVYSYSSAGFEGELVSVEVDIRRGIPGIDIVGLPDGAVREAKERVRVAIRNSGFTFPADRILVNLAPAGVRKEGAAFDLAIAVAVLAESGQIHSVSEEPLLALGELELSGSVRSVRGVLSAVAGGTDCGVRTFIVPTENLREARSLGTGRSCGLSHLRNIQEALTDIPAIPARAAEKAENLPGGPLQYPDFNDLKGQPFLKRALVIAAAGGHHALLIGPPGCGKTMAARRFPALLSRLSLHDAVTVTRVHSLAGTLPRNTGLLRDPPFRMPHHSASLEGVIGGGRFVRPGEVSLAHRGVLFLDEAPEFRRHILQSLREPIEEGRVTISRAGSTYWFPADFQLLLAANPCPCGNLGHDEKVCLCAEREILRYRKKIQGPLLDRIDIRIPVRPVPPEKLVQEATESTADMRAQVLRAVKIQEARFRNEAFKRNSRIPPSSLMEYSSLDRALRGRLADAVRKLSLSSRAAHSVLRVARTIADLSGEEHIGLDHLFEAIQHRRYGDRDFFWNSA